jgi:hypothetical protein
MKRELVARKVTSGANRLTTMSWATDTPLIATAPRPRDTARGYAPLMGTKKIRRKAKKKKAPEAGTPQVLRKVRVRRSEALEMMRLAHEGDVESAKKYLRMVRPHLDEVAVHEVAWRCADPQERGGIETGADADGDYADVAVTA